LPLYEYKCEKCSHRFEKIEKHSASEIKKCPKCGSSAPRQLSAPGIQFKGSGWYVTDYAGKSSSAASEGDGASSKSDKSEAAGKAGKSESKSGESKSSEKSSEKSSSKKDKK